MPAHNKMRGSSGRLQQHHRTSSGGSSRTGLNNLVLTQKDQAAQPKQQNLKRAGNSAAELHQSRQYPRATHLTANSRARSKDQIAAGQRRVHTHLSSKGKQHQAQAEQQQHHRQPQRPSFSLAHSDETTDSDDEWVSSESGAVTPQTNADLEAQAQREHEDEDDVTAGQQQREAKINGNGNNIYGDADRADLIVANGPEGVMTPRAEVNVDLSRVDTIRPEPDTAGAASPRARALEGQGQRIMKTAIEPPPVVLVQAQSTPATPIPPTPPTPAATEQLRNTNDPTVRHAHSEAPSPTQLRQKAAASRHPTLVRQLSTHGPGDAKKDMPPHPLIRGKSYHGGAALRPARLAPLTVNSETAQAQLMASPSGVVAPSRARSPSFLSTSINKSPSDVSTESRDRFPSRKNSISSLHSIATLPAPGSRFTTSIRGKQSQNPYPNRTRTLSTLSTSSSSAALAALSTLPSVSMFRPSSPPLVVRFPAESRQDREKDLQEWLHSLLPPSYLTEHLTTIAKYNPLSDSWERVMRARHGK